ncbi:hypothetical protein CANARDRAFT_30275 [[Candida] arabinofermentans NRRL YB-2248]|uniref:Uncharacterized protein n=1 Tax=[Candida] arabinofermentans NRRL YB-2248 TaxID=983967 RepID=A0A1E4SUJ7_9ASCO|nr:hypothetical protein CANARDRAFT_30275 [[Candida] arabinofermentans NRRL YB-2248]
MEMDRKVALEAKRKKLEELKRRRLEQQQSSSINVGLTLSPSTSTARIDITDNDENKITEEPPIHHDNDIVEPTLPTAEENCETVKESIMYDKAIETTDLFETVDDDNLIKKQYERELRAKLEAELRISLEKEYNMKLKASIEKKASEIEMQSEINKLFKSEPTSEPKKQGPIDEINVDKDSEYAKPINDDSILETPLNETIISSRLSLFDLSLTKDSVITSIDWSPFYPELVLAAYSGALTDFIIIWNLKTKSKEFLLLSYTKLSVAKFSESKSNQVIAGCSNGKIYLWEFDSNSRYPISSTTTIEKSAIIYLSENTNSIVSISSGGSLAIHSKNLVSLISQTQISISQQQQQQEQQQKQKYPMFQITASYIDSQYLTVGLSTGQVYMYQLNLINDSDSIVEVFKGINLPVMSISSSSKCIICASLDYKLKIHYKTHQENESSSTTMINCTNLVTDLKLKPTNGNDVEFVTVTSDGQVELWNLTENNLSPIETISIPSDNLNKVAWNTHGDSFIVGGLKGTLSYFKLKQ